MASRAGEAEQPEPSGTEEPLVLCALPAECVGAVCRCLDLSSVLRFSECGTEPHTLAGADEVWRDLFEARAWSRTVEWALPPSGALSWRCAYRAAMRAESPLVLHLSSLRSLVGFAREAAPRASRGLAPGSALGAVLGDALRAAELASWHGLDVVLVTPAFLGLGEVEELLGELLSRGAWRARLADADASALSHAGAASGAVLTIDLEGCHCGCVLEGRHRAV